ncbi:MAG TPA: DUF6252 family protein [Gemmatimonadales bacterium]|jgi:hypothetical protein|nr:DUF6252 family protein [Gemmatimonadales bacterium]
MRTQSRSVLFLSALALAACGGSSTPTGSNNNNGNNTNVHGTMTATVNGSAFSASYISRATVSGNIISIVGEQVLGTTNITSITFAVGNISVGTFSLANTDAHGGNAILTLGTNVYSSAASGGSGSVIFTAYDSTHIAGTFSFVGVASTGNATVTNGQFDLTF